MVAAVLPQVAPGPTAATRESTPSSSEPPPAGPSPAWPARRPAAPARAARARIATRLAAGPPAAPTPPPREHSTGPSRWWPRWQRQRVIAPRRSSTPVGGVSTRDQQDRRSPARLGRAQSPVAASTATTVSPRRPAGRCHASGDTGRPARASAPASPRYPRAARPRRGGQIGSGSGRAATRRPVRTTRTFNLRYEGKGRERAHRGGFGRQWPSRGGIGFQGCRWWRAAVAGALRSAAQEGRRGDGENRCTGPTLPGTEVPSDSHDERPSGPAVTR